MLITPTSWREIERWDYETLDVAAGTNHTHRPATTGQQLEDTTMKTYEFTIKAVGRGNTLEEAWEDVHNSEHINGLEAADAEPVLIEEDAE